MTRYATLVTNTGDRWQYNLPDPRGFLVWIVVDDEDEAGVLDARLLLGRPLDVIDRLLFWRTKPPEDDGARMSWLAAEVADAGLEFLMGWHSYATRGEVWMTFLLEHGLAPGQPFLARLRATYTRSYEGEYDADFDWSVVGREQVAEEEALRRWENFLFASTLESASEFLRSF